MSCMQDVRAANVRALSDSLVLTCHRDDFQTHLGRLTDIRRLWRFEALRKVCLSHDVTINWIILWGVILDIISCQLKLHQMFH